MSGKVTDCPTEGDAGDTAPTVMFEMMLTLIVTVPDWPDEAAVPLPDATPAVAVTFEILLVVSTVCALPF